MDLGRNNDRKIRINIAYTVSTQQVMEVGVSSECGRARPSSPGPDFKITTLPETEMVCNGCERSEFAQDISNTQLVTIWAWNISKSLSYCFNGPVSHE